MKSHIRLAILLILLNITAGTAADKDIRIVRGQSWLRVQYKMSLIKKAGIGFTVMSGSRYNHRIRTDVDGAAATGIPQDFWLQEFWAGPTWKKKLSDKWILTANLVYRPQIWYPDDTGGASYIRQTIANTWQLNYIHPGISPHYRLKLWNHFAARDGAGARLHNEFYTRHLLGVTIPIMKKFSFILDDEVFIKHTADKNDIDGTEVLSKHVVWTGFQWNAAAWLDLKLEYVMMSINKTDTPLISKQIADHYMLLWAVFKH